MAAALCLLVGAAGWLALFGGAASRAAAGLPPIHHVFVIVLENEDDLTTFGPPPPAPYLANTMVAEGAYLPNYYGVGHNSLDNYIAMISGQAPNPATQADCGTYVDVAPAGDWTLRPGDWQRLRVPGRCAHDRRSAHRRRADLGQLRRVDGQRPGARQHDTVRDVRAPGDRDGG